MPFRNLSYLPNHFPVFTPKTLPESGSLTLNIHQPASGPVQLSAPVNNHRLDIIGLQN